MNVIRLNMLVALLSPVLSQLEVYRRSFGGDGFKIKNPSNQLNDCTLFRNAQLVTNVLNTNNVTECTCPKNTLYARENEGLGCYTEDDFEFECKYHDVSSRYSDKNFYIDNQDCPKKNITGIAIWNIRKISTMITSGTQVKGHWHNLQRLNLFNVTRFRHKSHTSQFFFEPVGLNRAVLLGHIMKITFACQQCAMFVFKDRDEKKEIKYPIDVDNLIRELKETSNQLHTGSNNVQLITYTVLPIVLVVLLIILCVIIYQKRKKKDGSVEWTNDSNSEKGKMAIRKNEEKHQGIVNPPQVKSLPLEMLSKKNDNNNYDYAYTEGPSSQTNSNASTLDLVANTNKSNEAHSSVYNAMNTDSNPIKLSPLSVKRSEKNNDVVYAVLEPETQNAQNFQLEKEPNAVYDQVADPLTTSCQTVGYMRLQKKPNAEYALLQREPNTEYDQVANPPNISIQKADYTQVQKNLDRYMTK